MDIVAIVYVSSTVATKSCQLRELTETCYLDEGNSKQRLYLYCVLERVQALSCIFCIS